MAAASLQPVMFSDWQAAQGFAHHDSDGFYGAVAARAAAAPKEWPMRVDVNAVGRYASTWHQQQPPKAKDAAAAVLRDQPMSWQAKTGSSSSLTPQYVRASAPLTEQVAAALKKKVNPMETADRDDPAATLKASDDALLGVMATLKEVLARPPRVHSSLPVETVEFKNEGDTGFASTSTHRNWTAPSASSCPLTPQYVHVSAPMAVAPGRAEVADAAEPKKLDPAGLSCIDGSKLQPPNMPDENKPMFKLAIEAQTALNNPRRSAAALKEQKQQKNARAKPKAAEKAAASKARPPSKGKKPAKETVPMPMPTANLSPAPPPAHLVGPAVDFTDDGKEVAPGIKVSEIQVKNDAYKRAEWKMDDFRGKLQACMGRPIVSPSFNVAGLPNLRLMVFPDAREAVRTVRSSQRKGMYAAMVKNGPLYSALRLKADCSGCAKVIQFYLTCGSARRGPYTYDFAQQAIAGCDDFGICWLQQMDSAGNLRVGVEVLEDTVSSH